MAQKNPKKPKRYIVFDRETYHDSDNFVPPKDDKFPPPFQHRVVAIGRALLDENCMPLRTACPVNLEDERGLLKGFSKSVQQHGKNADLVSWNGRTFDMLVITSRSMRHMIELPWFYNNRDMRLRYSAKGHIDLMDHLSHFDYRSAMKLSAAADLCSLDGKTANGLSVAQLVEEDRTEELGWYCINDVRITACMMARFKRLRGELSVVQVKAVESAWEDWMEDCRDGGWNSWKAEDDVVEDDEEDDEEWD